MILPRCKEVSTAVASGEFASAPALARLRMRLHLLICAHCRKFKRQLELIGLALRQGLFAPPDAARTAALERAVLARLRAL
jgi:hypothetical protein